MEPARDQSAYDSAVSALKTNNSRTSTPREKTQHALEDICDGSPSELKSGECETDDYAGFTVVNRRN